MRRRLLWRNKISSLFLCVQLDLLSCVAKNILGLNEVVNESFSHLDWIWLLTTYRVEFTYKSTDWIELVRCRSSWTVRA
jgi:hypothetical protein